MITYSNIQRHDGIPFEEYLKLPGYSHSYLKSNVGGLSPHFNVTDKVTIGKIVDSILTEPAKADITHPLYQACKEIAYELTKLFGDVFNICSKQVNYTATMSMQGLSMPVKGRLDLLLESVCVIDLKITNERNVDELVSFMGYENQLLHYAKMARVPKAYLLIYSRPLKRVFVRKVDVSSDTNSFWVNKLIDFGTAERTESLTELDAPPDFII